MITDFRGPHRWLSNFHLANIVFEGEIYPSSEHAYQAAKADCVGTSALFPEPSTAGLAACDEERARFREPGLTCRDAKRLGSAIRLRWDWDDVRLGIMETILRDKFSRHADLQRLLLETGDEVLVEGNSWGDRYWGVSPPPPEGTGDNHLGRLLMQIRRELRETDTDRP